MSLEDKRANFLPPHFIHEFGKQKSWLRILFMSYDLTPEIIHADNPHTILLQSAKIRVIPYLLYYYHDDDISCNIILLVSKHVLSIYQSMYVCMYVSAYLSVCLSICLSVSVYLSICLSVYLSICLSVYLSICLSVYLSICLSIYLSIYL